MLDDVVDRLPSNTIATITIWGRGKRAASQTAERSPLHGLSSDIKKPKTLAEWEQRHADVIMDQGGSYSQERVQEFLHAELTPESKSGTCTAKTKTITKLEGSPPTLITPSKFVYESPTQQQDTGYGISFAGCTRVQLTRSLHAHMPNML